MGTQNASCHCCKEFSTSSKCPVDNGARKPLRFATVFDTAMIGPAYLGAKSRGLIIKFEKLSVRLVDN